MPSGCGRPHGGRRTDRDDSFTSTLLRRAASVVRIALVRGGTITSSIGHRNAGTFAVLGGTGAYANARGAVLVRQLSAAARVTFTLLPRGGRRRACGACRSRRHGRRRAPPARRDLRALTARAGPRGATGPAGPQGAAGADGATGPKPGLRVQPDPPAPRAPRAQPALPAPPALPVPRARGACGACGPCRRHGASRPTGATGATGAAGPAGPPGVSGLVRVAVASALDRPRRRWRPPPARPVSALGGGGVLTFGAGGGVFADLASPGPSRRSTAAESERLDHRRRQRNGCGRRHPVGDGRRALCDRHLTR